MSPSPRPSRLAVLVLASALGWGTLAGGCGIKGSPRPPREEQPAPAPSQNESTPAEQTGTGPQDGPGEPGMRPADPPFNPAGAPDAGTP